MLFIKIKLNGYLKNITEKSCEIIDTKAVKNKNNITYIHKEIQHKIIISKNKITLSRNNENFSNIVEFIKDKTIETEYYIKEYNTSITIKIKTEDLIISNNKIQIKYKIIDSNEDYEYLIEMSE